MAGTTRRVRGGFCSPGLRVRAGSRAIATCAAALVRGGFVSLDLFARAERAVVFSVARLTCKCPGKSSPATQAHVPLRDLDLLGLVRERYMWGENRLFQGLAGGGAHLVHGREAHAAALVHLDLKAHGLKGRGAHAPHVLDKVLARDGARARRLDRKAAGLRRERGVVRAGKLNTERLAQTRRNAHVHRALTGDLALEGGARTVDGGLAANHAHDAPGRHGARHLALDDAAGRGIGGRQTGEELVRVVGVAKLEQVARAHGLAKLDARDGGTAAAIVARESARVDARGLAFERGAHDLAAVVGALVAHHLVARGAVLVGMGEVAVEAALELALTCGALAGLGHAARKHVVKLATVGVDHGVDVVGCLHASLELEGVRTGGEHALEHLGGVGVARAEWAPAIFGGDISPVLVDKLVGESARLRAHAAVGRAARHGKAREQAEPRVAKADCPVAEDLEVDLGHLARDMRDLGGRELAREGHAVGAGIAAPGRAARVMDVRLRGDVRLDARHKLADLKEESPVLDDECVSPEHGAAAHELERRRHLGLLDDDVHRHVHARAGHMGLAARRGKGLVGEVRRLASRVEGAHAAVDGVGAGCKRGSEGLRPAGGGKQFGLGGAGMRARLHRGLSTGVQPGQYIARPEER